MHNDPEFLSDQLRRTENILNASQALSKVGGWEYDVTQETIYWTEEIFRIHGMEPGGIGPLPHEAISSSIACYWPDDQARVMAAFQECITDGTPYDLVLPFKTVKGEEKWVRTCAYRVVEEGGQQRVYGNLMDITEVVEAEAALREGEKKYRTIVKTAIDGFWMADLQGRLLDVNEAYSRMSGYSIEELLTLSIADLEHALNPEQVMERIRYVLEHGYDRFETQHRRKDGTIYDLEVGVQHLEQEGGVLLTFLRDITERKQAEAEKDKLQGQLIQAQKMESIGRLAGGVAHDFNNMLSVIQGYAELGLDTEGLDPEVANALREILRATGRSTDVARQMLAFARKQTIAPRQLNLNDKITNLLKMIRRLIGEDIDLAWIPGQDLWSVKMDPAQVDQILVNLCVNARDAIEDVGKLTIETANVDFDDAYCRDHPGFSPGQFVALSVSDDGHGMDKDTMHNIFEPFFSTKGPEKGTGLGLATVYGIVKQNEGFINVYSEVGLGSCFKVYLSRSDTPHETESLARGTGHGLGDGETILLVEDEASILAMTTRLLTKLGYNVLSADSPDRALELAEEHRDAIDLLMTDVVMPGMNGRVLAGRIQEIHPGIKYLFMSGYTANVIAHHGVLDRGVNFLQKPFSRKDLSAKLQEVLANGNDLC